MQSENCVIQSAGENGSSQRVTKEAKYFKILKFMRRLLASFLRSCGPTASVEQIAVKNHCNRRDYKSLAVYECHDSYLGKGVHPAFHVTGFQTGHFWKRHKERAGEQEETICHQIPIPVAQILIHSLSCCRRGQGHAVRGREQGRRVRESAGEDSIF